MTVQPSPQPPDDRLPLEAVEFELALRSQNIVETGFQAALGEAAERSQGKVLFDMPASDIADCQRIAAVSLGNGEDAQTVLVLLGSDGGSFRLENASESESPFAGIALSYRGLLDCFDRIELSAA